MTLRLLATSALLFIMGLNIEAQIEFGPLEYNPAYRQHNTLQKAVEHPNCLNRPFLFIDVNTIVQPECGSSNGSITVNVLSSEPSVGITLNEDNLTSVSTSTYTIDNLSAGVYFIDGAATAGDDQELLGGVRVVLNNEGINESAYYGAFETDAAFCSDGAIRKLPGLAIAVNPTWQIFTRDGTQQGELTITNTEAVLSPGEYYLELVGFDGCEIYVDFTVPEVVSFEFSEEADFFDDFSNTYVFPDDTYWSDDQAFINESFAFDPPSMGVATLDGLDENGEAYIPSPDLAIGTADRLTSVPFCMDGIAEADSLYLSYYYQQQGLGDYPNAGDQLALEFKDIRIDDNGVTHPGQWNAIRVVQGQNEFQEEPCFNYVVQAITDDLLTQPLIIDTTITINAIDTLAEVPLILDTIFNDPVYDTLGTATFFDEGFQFRFRSIATATGNNDHWNIDYVYLDKDRNASTNAIIDVAHNGPVKGFLKNYSAMPWNQFANYQEKELDQVFEFPLRNNATNPTQIQKTVVTVTELCSETVIDSINAEIFNIDGAGPIGAQGSCTLALSTFGNADTTLTNNNVGGDLLERSFIPTGFDVDDGIVIRTETVLDVSDDVISTNDTLVHEQLFSNFFAYDDGSAEWVLKMNGIGTQMAYQFVANEPDAVTGIGFSFNQIVQNVEPGEGTLRLMVWEEIRNADGTGEDSLLYDDIEVPFPLVGDQQNDYYHYYFNEDVAVQDTFYVGFELISPDNISIGYDRNNDNMDKWFFRIGSFWENQVPTTSAPPGSPMIRAIMATGQPLGIETALETFELFPNPTADILNIGLPENNGDLNYRIFSTSGQQMRNATLGQGTIDVSELPAGVYLLEVSDGQTTAYKRQKFVKL